MFNELPSLLGLEKCNTCFGDVLSLNGKYKNISCNISVRVVVGENSPHIFYVVACFYLSHFDIPYSKVNPRKINVSDGKGQRSHEWKQYRKEPNLLISMINLMNCQDFLINSPLYQIELEGNHLIGYFNAIDDNNHTNLECINFLVQLTRKIDWYLNSLHTIEQRDALK